MKTIPSIIAQLLNSIDYAVPIYSAEPVQGGTKLTCGDTLHARAGIGCAVGTAAEKILSVSGNAITVTGAHAEELWLELDKPRYLHGTPIAVNAAMASMPTASKAPVIYLYEVLRDRHHTAPNAVYAREAQIALFFLDSCDIGWRTEDHYERAIGRMLALAERTAEAILESPLFFAPAVKEIDYICHADFGKYEEGRGHTKTIFNERYSGVEMRLNLPVAHESSCNNQ